MQAISQIKPSFKPDTERDAKEKQSKSKAILIMLSMDRRDVSPELATAYHIVARNYRLETVERAADDFINGRVNDVNKAFCPTPAQFGTQCRKIQVPEDAFNKVWQPSKAQQLESRDSQRERELLVEAAKTPEQKLEAINKIRKAQGIPPFNPYKEAKRHTSAKPTLEDIKTRDKPFAHSPSLLKTLEAQNV